MHKIIFKELEFRNFMSYGNTKNVFEFHDGLTWLSGDNGFGKSAIVEAMTFALLGVSYRGGKKEELRNSKNAEDGVPTTVMLTFDTDDPLDGLNSYRVTRTISGKTSTVKFVIEKMEDGDWVPQNKRAGFSQQDFQDKILQFNEILFKNVIAMNTQETLPFFMLPPAEKRKLLESIISLSLDVWKKANSKRLSEATVSLNVAQAESDQLKDEIAELAKILNQMKEERSDNLEQMKADLATNEATLAELNAKIDELNNTRRQWNEDLNNLSKKLRKESSVDARIEEIRNTTNSVAQLESAKTQLDEAQAEYDRVIRDTAKDTEEVQRARDNQIIQRDNIDKLTDEKNRLERSVASKGTTLDLTIKRRDGYAETAKSFVVGTPCPTCGHISDESDVERHKETLRAQWTEANNEVKALKKEIADINNDIAEHDRLIEEADKLEADYGGTVAMYDENIAPLIMKAQGSLDAAKNNYAKLSRIASGFDADAINAELESLKAEKAGFPAIREAYETKATEINELTDQIGEVNGQINHADREIDRLKGEIEKAENATDDAIAVMESKITRNKAMRQDALSRMQKASDTMLICDVVTKICADQGGMKQMVFSMFVPAFNKAVARNLKRANLPFSVQFTDSMDFIYTPYPGGAPSYKMLSQGQHRKLDFAVAMAFRDFVALIGNFNVNFLSLDEVLDISTDDNAMRDMLDLVKDMLDEIGCAVIITHRGSVVADKFDYRQKVTNNGMYSMLTPLKPMWMKEAS